MTGRQVGELGVLQLTLNDTLDSEVSVVESKRCVDRFFSAFEDRDMQSEPIGSSSAPQKLGIWSIRDIQHM